jgi:hypothetical protein
MRLIEMRRATRARRRPVLIGGLAFALMSLMAGPGGTPAQAAPRPVVRMGHLIASGAAHAHSHAAGHKQGSLAIAVSVLGIVVVIVLLFVLGSISVRRRGRSTPLGRDDEREPRRPGRGLFG